MPLTLDGFRTGVGPSPAIWSRVKPTDKLFRGAWKHFYEDFTNFGLSTAVSSNVGRYSSESGQWISYEDTGDSIAQLATDDNGVVTVSVAATNNNESWMMPGGAASVFATPKTRANYGQSIFFEARIKTSQITSGNLFCGLTEEGLAAADTITDSDAFADKDLIGFMVLEAAPSSVAFKYNKAGAGGITSVIAAAHTLVADTYVKLGFIVDMEEGSASKRIKAYVDGVEQGTYVTNTAFEAAAFPTGEELHFLFGAKNQNAAKTVSIDWVRIAQSKGD